jgi:hypothetical protein
MRAPERFRGMQGSCALRCGYLLMGHVLGHQLSLDLSSRNFGGKPTGACWQYLCLWRAISRLRREVGSIQESALRRVGQRKEGRDGRITNAIG